MPKATVAHVRRAFDAAAAFRSPLTRHERAIVLRRTAPETPRPFRTPGAIGRVPLLPIAGSVAALQGIKNPAQVARLVMEQTDRVLLVGEGALRFAKKMGFKEESIEVY